MCERLATVAEVAAIARVSEREVYRLAARGLPHLRVGRQLRFILPEVLAALRAEPGRRGRGTP